MSRTFDFASGFVIGAALMGILDPVSGSRRRGLVRDKAIRTVHRSKKFLRRAGRDLRNRTRGGSRIPARQGGAPRQGKLPEWARSNWTPGVRLLAGVAGIVALTAATTAFARARERLTPENGPDYAHLV